jgi:hypothetical protein
MFILWASLCHRLRCLYGDKSKWNEACAHNLVAAWMQIWLPYKLAHDWISPLLLEMHQKLRTLILYDVLLEFWADHWILICTYCHELIKLVGSHGSSSLLFMTCVMVWHFVSNSHRLWLYWLSCYLQSVCGNFSVICLDMFGLSNVMLGVPKMAFTGWSLVVSGDAVLVNLECSLVGCGPQWLISDCFCSAVLISHSNDNLLTETAHERINHDSKAFMAGFM